MFERPLKRILLVDDDPDIQALASLALIGLGGYAVEVCSSAPEALDRAACFKPDLIVLDVIMPGTDGVGALKAFRELEATSRTPVVFMTAKAEPDEIVEYRELGCLGVVAKPFDPSALPETLEILWGRHLERVTEALRVEFEGLRQTYAEELQEKIGAMQEAAALLARSGWDRPTVESLYMLTHRMAGSSGLYRMEALSRAAGALEAIVKRLLNGSAWPPASSPNELTTLVKAVGRTARSEARLAQRAEAKGADR